MEMLGGTEYGILERPANGPVGVRHVVQADSATYTLVADIVRPGADEYLSAVCLNAERTRQWTDDAKVANVLEAGWMADGRYFQVLDMTPSACPLTGQRNRLSEREFWNTARSLMYALRHLHRRELVHGSLAPSCIYRDGDTLRLAELWFAHNADGLPLYDGLSQFFPAKLPDYSMAFTAPEVLLGNPPERESDVYSLGAVLFYLLTGELPRQQAFASSHYTARTALAEAPLKDLDMMRPDLSSDAEAFVLSMLDDDPAERPTILFCEAICSELSNATA